MNLIEECANLDDEELERNLKFLVEKERRGGARLIAHLAEFDRRQRCVKRGYSNLFAYCVTVLHYDEGGAFRRIRAARVARKFPEVLEKLEAGILHLTSLVLLAPVIKIENRKELLAAAEGKTRRELETFLARKFPQAAQSDFARRMPVAGGWSVAVTTPVNAVEAVPLARTPDDLGTRAAAPPSAPVASPAPAERPWEWQAVVPVAMDRVRIGFDAGLSIMKLIERARQVLRHKYPEGRLEDIVKDALEIFLDRKDPQRRLVLKPVPVVRDALPPPREPRFLRDAKAGRYIPQWVKRAVWERDGGRCAWRADDGTLCGSKDWIEYDHVRPFAKGGRSDSPRNVRLLCRAHNQLRAAEAGLSAPASSGSSNGAGARPDAGGSA